MILARPHAGQENDLRLAEDMVLSTKKNVILLQHVFKNLGGISENLTMLQFSAAGKGSGQKSMWNKPFQNMFSHAYSLGPHDVYCCCWFPWFVLPINVSFLCFGRRGLAI